MDRLDSWLNGQVGLRRVIVAWLVLCPLAVGLGISFLVRSGPGVPMPGTRFLEVTAVSVLAGAPVAALVAAYERNWSARNPGKPYLSWRMIVAGWCVAAGFLLGDQPWPARMPNVVWLAQLALLITAIVFWVLAVRRRRHR